MNQIFVPNSNRDGDGLDDDLAEYLKPAEVSFSSPSDFWESKGIEDKKQKSEFIEYSTSATTNFIRRNISQPRQSNSQKTGKKGEQVKEFTIELFPM